ncbi:MAG: hypothetical protein Q7R81_05735 [Candidatus Peregrinibacteria bacterium]|nr:hypothetical protein [Candidatus Peregrinibacteria bacterium]
MSFLKSPKLIIVLGAVVLAALVALVGRESMLRRSARRLPAAIADLAPERMRELQEDVTKREAEIQKNINDFSAYVALSLAKTELGDRDGAAEIYRTMNQLFPGNYLSFQNLGKLYEETGKYEMAAEQFLIAIDHAPRIPHMYRNLVNLYTYHLKSRTEDIPRVLQKGLGIIPGSVDLMAMMAVYYRDRGDLTQAIHWYELLLVHDQSNGTALEELKELKAQMSSEK